MKTNDDFLRQGGFRACLLSLAPQQSRSDMRLGVRHERREAAPQHLAQHGLDQRGAQGTYRFGPEPGSRSRVSHRGAPCCTRDALAAQRALHAG